MPWPVTERGVMRGGGAMRGGVAVGREVAAWQEVTRDNQPRQMRCKRTREEEGRMWRGGTTRSGQVEAPRDGRRPRDNEAEGAEDRGIMTTSQGGWEAWEWGQRLGRVGGDHGIKCRIYYVIFLYFTFGPSPSSSIPSPSALAFDAGQQEAEAAEVRGNMITSQGQREAWEWGWRLGRVGGNHGIKCSNNI